jgi:hypothetical protein
LLLRNVVSVESELQVRVEIRIHGKPYALTVTRNGFKLVPKGKRKGIQMPWAVFVEDDDAVLYSELQASIRKILGARD